MKKTIVKPDGSTETVEGTAQEIADYERKVKGENQNESPKPKVPGLLTDDLVRRLDEIRRAAYPGEVYFTAIPQHRPDCSIIIAQRGWWSVNPPTCTCGFFVYPGTFTSTTTFSSDRVIDKIAFNEDPVKLLDVEYKPDPVEWKKLADRQLFHGEWPGCMGRPNS